VDCRADARPFLLPFYPVFFSLLSSRLQTSQETEAAWLASPVRWPWWRWLHKYYANIRSRAGVTHRARARETVRLLAAPRDSSAPSVVAYFQRDMHDSRVSLPYRPEIACTLHTRHNSTPNLHLRPPASLPRSLLYRPYLSFLFGALCRSALPRCLLARPPRSSIFFPSTRPLSRATSSRLRRPYVVVSYARFDLWRAPGFGTWKRAQSSPVSLRRSSH